ncbi:DUF456 domain-containing protein [Burkholderia gladioli]|uniref:DUF456 domain-containing protein n=1 Tax=Burkholderia gladioli TaxID=28095 RepID=UPI0012D33864|nr:DUF456 domain-containing protein [Burkholderia gladioli]
MLRFIHNYGGEMSYLGRVLGVMAIIVVVFMVADFCATSMGTKPYDATLMASWMQAIGSIAAIFGALWIAFQQDLKRKRDELQAAMITASGMAFRLRENLDELAEVVTEFDRMARFDYNPFRLEPLGDRIKLLRRWSSDEEIALIPLGAQCAVNLASARDHLHLVSLKINGFFGSDDASNSEARREFSAKLAIYLGTAHRHLMCATEVCDRSVNKLRK